MFQHTATRRWLHLFSLLNKIASIVSTHSHPKVAAKLFEPLGLISLVSTHSHPKVAAFPNGIGCLANLLFQHTATRRWLLLT